MRVYERKQAAALQAAADAGAMGGEGALGGELGGLTGAGEDLGDDLGGDLGGDLEGDLGGDEASPEGDEGMLLATPDEAGPPPGHRKSPTIYKGKPGHGTSKYHPKKNDVRNMGARKRGMLRVGSPEVNTYRKNNLGAPELRSLANGSVYGEEQTIYNDGENRLFEINHEVRDLIELLENKNTESDTSESKNNENKAQ